MLYRNSFFIMLTSFFNTGVGFIFWMIAARLYTDSDVGIATALISSSGLIILLTRLGLDQSLLRFFPDGNKNNIFTTSIAVTTIASILAGIIFILGARIWSAELQLSMGSGLIYLIFLIASSVVYMVGIAFNILRRSDYNLFQNIFSSIRVLLLFPLISFGSIGIFLSLGLSLILSLMVSIFLLSKLSIKPANWDNKFLRDSFQYATGNYLTGLFVAAPSLVLPLLVMNVLGTNETAYVYIALSIGSLLFIIPSSFSLSLLIEGCHGETLGTNIKRSLFATAALMIPAILVLFFFAEFLLSLIGPSYVAAANLLRILVISSLFGSICNINFSIMRVQKNIKQLLILSISIFIIIILGSYIFMLTSGINGVGYAYVAGYAFGCTLIACMNWKNYLPRRERYGWQVRG